jgi:hypothetical protein
MNIRKSQEGENIFESWGGVNVLWAQNKDALRCKYDTLKHGM